MARVTVEDCLIKVPNCFDLVVLAAQRARQLSAGVPPTVDRGEDKSAVLALREIAKGTIDAEQLYNSLVNLHRQYSKIEPQEEELESIFSQEVAGYSSICSDEEDADVEDFEENSDEEDSDSIEQDHSSLSSDTINN